MSFTKRCQLVVQFGGISVDETHISKVLRSSQAATSTVLSSNRSIVIHTLRRNIFTPTKYRVQRSQEWWTNDITQIRILSSTSCEDESLLLADTVHYVVAREIGPCCLHANTWRYSGSELGVGHGASCWNSLAGCTGWDLDWDSWVLAFFECPAG